MSRNLPTPSKRVMKRLLFLTLPLGLMSCAASQPPAEIKVVQNNTGCKVFKQISWGIGDQKLTVQQILAHNRAHAKFCKK